MIEPAGSTFVAAGTPGNSDEGSADTNGGTGATATAVTVEQGGVADTLNHNDADGNAAPADAAPLGDTQSAPLVETLAAPHIAPLTLLPDDMNTDTDAAVLSATPSEPPVPKREPILEDAVTTTTTAWAEATAALALQIGPPEPQFLPLDDGEANDGAAPSRSSRTRVSAWSTTIILPASVALLTPALPSAFFAQPSHSSHVTRSNAGHSCCSCVAALACLAVHMGLAEHIGPRAAHEAPLLAQLPRRRILGPSPPARNPASSTHALSEGQPTCGPWTWPTGSLHEGGIRSVHSLPQRRPRTPSTVQQSDSPRLIL